VTGLLPRLGLGGADEGLFSVFPDPAPIIVGSPGVGGRQIAGRHGGTGLLGRQGVATLTSARANAGTMPTHGRSGMRS